MAKKIEIVSNNVLLITDTDTGEEILDILKGIAYYSFSDLIEGYITIIPLKNVKDLENVKYLFPKRTSIKLSEAIDANNQPFSRESFKTFAREKLGNSTALGGSEAHYLVEENITYSRIERGAYRELSFSSPSFVDGDDPIDFPIAFSEAPKHWNVSVFITNDEGGGSGSVIIGSITSSSMTVNRNNDVDNASNPVWIIKVTGLI